MPAPTPAAGLYLDLLRRCLTREIFEDTGVTIEPHGQTWKSRLAKGALGLLARRRLRLVRQTQSTLEDKLEGWGWPGHAESMCGSRRLEFFQKLLYAIERDRTPGDLFEGGCWRGGAVIMMLAAEKVFGRRERTIWAADSFEGYPAPTDNSSEDDRYLFAQGAYFRLTREDFEQNVKRYDLMSDKLVVLEGYFDRSLPKAGIGELALIRVDIDGYEGVRTILDNLYPKLSPGGFVVVDDYVVPGAKRAVDEYFATHGLTEQIRSIPQKMEKAIYFQKQA